MTAAAQPLDQGIIQSFKLRYRRSLMDKLLASAEYCKSSTEFTASINVLDSVRWIRAAWDSLDRSTIIKCFKRSGFNSLDDVSNEVTITEIVETTPLETTNIATYNEITITERTELLNTYSEPIKNLGWIDSTIEEFIILITTSNFMKLMVMIQIQFYVIYYFRHLILSQMDLKTKRTSN